MSKEEAVEVTTVVLETLPNALLKIAIDGNEHGFCPYLGQYAEEFFRPLPSDKVLVELSPQGLDRGRITYRYR